MKIYVGTDHAGFGHKEKLIPFLKSLGYEVEDKGAFDYDETDDYPDFIGPVAKAVAANPEVDRGIIMGGSGQGEAMYANRFLHVRAAVYYGPAKSLVGNVNDTIITLSRGHNDANILSLAAHFITEEDMKSAVKTWLEAPFTGDERHKRRILKIDVVN